MLFLFFSCIHLLKVALKKIRCSNKKSVVIYSLPYLISRVVTVMKKKLMSMFFFLAAVVTTAAAVTTAIMSSPSCKLFILSIGVVSFSPLFFFLLFIFLFLLFLILSFIFHFFKFSIIIDKRRLEHLVFNCA